METFRLVRFEDEGLTEGLCLVLDVCLGGAVEDWS